MHGLPSLRTAALVRAIVHNRNPRVHGANQSVRVRLIQAVMAYQENIDLADEVVGTDQLHLLLLGQIPKIKKAELFICNQHAKRGRVFGWVLGGRWLRLAQRIGLSGALQWLIDVLSRRRNDLYIES